MSPISRIPARSGLKLIRRFGFGAYFCTPLLAREHFLGTLSFATRSRERFTEEELEFLGTVARYIALTDERLRAERELRSSEERFRHLADAMPQLVWSADPDGKVDYYSRRRDEFSGFSREPDGSWKWAPVLHPDDLEATVTAWEQAIRTGTPYQVEHRVRRADGTFRWYMSRAVPIRDGEGRLVKWYGTTTDIEDLKRTETALRESEARFRAFFENAAVGATEMDLSARFIRVNERFCRLTGYGREELLQLTPHDITLPADRGREQEAFEQASARDIGHPRD